jgi:hypothetical protein
MKHNCDVYFEVSILLTYDTAVLDIWFVMFWDNIVISSSTVKMIKNSSWRWDHHIVTKHCRHRMLRCSSIKNSSATSLKYSWPFHLHFGLSGSCCQLRRFWKTSSSWRWCLFIPSTCFLCCHKTSGTKYLVRQCHIPKKGHLVHTFAKN